MKTEPDSELLEAKVEAVINSMLIHCYVTTVMLVYIYK